MYSGGALHRPILLVCTHPSCCLRAFIMGPDVSSRDRQYMRNVQMSIGSYVADMEVVKKMSAGR